MTVLNAWAWDARATEHGQSAAPAARLPSTAPPSPGKGLQGVDGLEEDPLSSLPKVDADGLDAFPRAR
ncbi:hypothetical protein [Corallococcus exiguus]|uniref:Uncharacterized protein n=1 Tax=Corallococcus exiguus TaxID=83462 RepID=A0A7X4Y7N9_9BACT|nr:hypothetical protein [Corallococcus exiguus]NBC40076.1 hypothetical protein [Corallococcus exiguus]TNV59580.1 hypothetical protein FH620_26600 [Corallococcus exiguus]